MCSSSLSHGKNLFSIVYTRIIAAVVVVLILFPLLIVAANSFRNVASNALPSIFYLENSGSSVRSVVNLSPVRTGRIFPVGSSLVVELEKLSYVESISILGERFVSSNIEGVEVFNYPNNSQSTEFVKNGVIYGSVDGIEFVKMREFNNVVNFHIYPVRFLIGETVKYLKIEICSGYDRSRVVVIGNVIVSGH